MASCRSFYNLWRDFGIRPKVNARKEVKKMKIHEEIRETLKKRLEKLSKRFSETEDLEEMCILNKEICRAEKVLLSLPPKLGI